jgi:hypothetical protein
MNKLSNGRQIFTLLKTQLCISLLIITLFFISCNLTSDKKIDNSIQGSLDSSRLSETQNASIDSSVHFLLNASAKDFHDHQPPVPVSFRNVQVRNLIGPNTENHYMLCGEFLGKENQNKDEWTSFATIKTSGYEQWIGKQSIGYCQDSKAVSYKINDLSLALKSRLDSLNNLHN